MRITGNSIQVVLLLTTCCLYCLPASAINRVIATGQIVHLHPSSVLRGKAPECVVFSELVRTTRQYAREVTRIQARWLPELAPAFFAAKAGAGVAAEAGGAAAASTRR
jgi:ATP-dependent RNA helicase DHX8/PRP22